MPNSRSFRLRTLWSDLPVRRRGALIVAIPITCLLTFVVAYTALSRYAQRSQQAIAQSQKVILTAEQILVELTDAEAGVQGYILTRQPNYLQPYQQTRQSVPKLLQTLKRLVQTAPEQQQRLRRIDQLTQQRMQALAASIQRANQTGSRNNSAVVLSSQLAGPTLQLRQQIKFLISQEKKRLQQQQTTLQQQQQTTNQVLGLTATLGILGSLAAVYLFDRLDRELAARQLNLQENNIRLKAILENVVDGILTIDEQGHIQSFNQAAQQMFGYLPQEVMGKNLKMLLGIPYTTDSVQTLNQFVGRDLSKIRHLQETWGRRRDGAVFPLELVFSEMQLAHQRLLIGILRDISDRKQAQERERRQAHLLDLANDTIIVRDGDDRITYWNQGAERMYGYSKIEALGQITHELLQTQFPEPFDQLVERFQEEGYWRGELIHRRKDGNYIQVSSRWTLQYDGEGEPLSTLEINSDITERKQAEEALKKRAQELAKLSFQLAQANQTLEKRNQELDQFAYIVSHDLKAPLRAIANLSQWIEEDLSAHLTPETEHNMNLLRGRVYRMEALIDGVLQYSRIGRVKSRIERVNVAEVVAEAIDSLAPPDHFKIKVQPALPTLKSERLPLLQVFSNLIGNSIKHHHGSTGQILVSAKDLGHAYEFQVKDNGPGISPRYHEKIFGIFQTLESRDKVESTGVGLSLVKKIVENQGGTIRIESDLGQGASFYFTWMKDAELGITS